MFRISRHDDGFAVRWDKADRDAASRLSVELFFSGLRQTRETGSSLVVPLSRSELESLRLLLGIVYALGVETEVDPSLSSRQRGAEAESELLRRVLADSTVAPSVDARLPEFRSGRALLDYQRDAVAKHLRVVH